MVTIPSVYCLSAIIAIIIIIIVIIIRYSVIMSHNTRVITPSSLISYRIIPEYKRLVNFCERKNIEKLKFHCTKNISLLWTHCFIRKTKKM